MTRRAFAALVVLLACLAASATAATTYYVSTTGLDSHDGSIGTPFLTIQHALDVAQTGDAIQLADGVYSGAGANINLDFQGKDIDIMGTSTAGTILDCAGANGPAIEIYSGTPTLAYMTLQNCASTTSAGGVLVTGAHTFVTFDHMNLLNCSSTFVGGAVLVALANVSFTHTVFDNNVALQGGAAYITSSLSVSFDTVTMTRSVGQQGGGLGIFSSTFTMTNSLIQRNTASLAGIFYFTLSSISITGTTFDSNSAVADGTCLYTTQSQLFVDNCQFTNNYNAASGGALTITASAYTNRVPDLIRNSYFGYNTMGDHAALYLKTVAIVRVENSTFVGNVAPSGPAVSASTDGNVTMYDCTMRDNLSTGLVTGVTFASPVTLSGGAVCAAKSGAYVLLSNCVMTNNTAQYGGAVFSINAAVVEIVGANTVIANNTATYMGGAIYVSDKSSKLSISSTSTVKIENNKAQYGGGFGVGALGTLTLKNVVFNRNVATQTGGGGWTQGTLGMTYTTFTNNTAGLLNGGVVYYYVPTSAVTCPTCTLSGNTDNVSAGAPVTSAITSSPSLLNVTTTSFAFAHGAGTTANPFVASTALTPGSTLTFDIKVYDSLHNLMLSVGNTNKIVASLSPINQGAFVGFAPAIVSSGAATITVTFVANLARVMTLTLQLTDLSGVPISTVATLAMQFNTTTSCGANQIAEPVTISAGVSYPACYAADLSTVSDGAFIAVQIITSFCVVGTLIVLWLVHRHRDHRSLKASSPLLLEVMLVSTVFIYVAVFIMGVNSGSSDNTLQMLSPVTTRICRVLPWLLGIGFDLIYGAMLAKAWRIHKIFNNRLRRRLVVSDFTLLKFIVIFAMHDVILNAVWVGYAPLTMQYYDMSTSATLVEVTTQCRSDQFNAFIAVYLAIKGAVLLYGVYLAVMCRNVMDSFNESKQLGFAIYNLTLVSCIIIPLVFFIHADATAVYLIAALGTLFAVVVTTAIIFVPKILLVYSSTKATDSGHSTSKNAQADLSDATEEQWNRIKAELSKLAAAAARHSPNDFNEVYDNLADLIHSLSNTSYESKRPKTSSSKTGAQPSQHVSQVTPKDVAEWTTEMHEVAAK